MCNPNVQSIAAWTRADARGYAALGWPENAAEFRLTGCTLFGGGFFGGFFSDPMIFMVANKDGHAAFVPLETHTKEDIQCSYYTDTNGDPVMTGWYVGSYPLPFDWVEAVERFGKK